jgi:hypothetical protein
MDEENKKALNDVINNPEKPGKSKFRAELLLLFDKYDSINPDTDINIIDFLGIIEHEKDALFHAYMMARDEYHSMPYWERQ